jgi:mannose-1-phosphate guanylyltransferase
VTPRRAGCDQAVILVGGEGTRLRPITSLVPKPVAPVVERPFVTYILENLVRHGVRRAVFSTGYLAEAIEAEIGDGRCFGVAVDYAVEDKPLGTAGAIKNAAGKLDAGPFLAFNGDVLTDVDLTALIALHHTKRAAATIYLTPVEDPRRYGLVELRGDGAVANFLEKPGEWQGEALINAGVYVLEHDVLEMIPAGVMFSIERGVFPRLAQAGTLYGFVGTGYWRDIGTPESYLEAHFDILDRSVFTHVVEQMGDTYTYVAPSASVDPSARLVPPCYIGDGVTIGAAARIGPLAVIGAGSRVEAGASVVESVVQGDVAIAANAVVEHSVVVRGSSLGEGSHVSQAVVGEGCRIGAGNRLANGISLYPQTVVPDGSVQFRELTEGRENR